MIHIDKWTAEQRAEGRKKTLARWYAKRKNDPLFIEERNRFCKSWRDRNPQKIKDYTASYYSENKETLLQKARAWEKQNPLSVRAHWIKKRTGLPISPKTIQEVYEENIRQFGTLTCYLCRQTIEFGKDCLEHKTPSDRGGSNEKSNLGVAHGTCNAKKRSMTESEYLEKVRLGK